MLHLTSTQIDVWISALLYPLARILGFIAFSPIWGTSGLPARTRLILALAITIAIAPQLPIPTAPPPLGSLSALGVLALQAFIGITMGFAARIVFASITYAGEMIGSQMGLGFATFYDPLNSSQTPVIGELLELLAFLVFLSINGHLMFVKALAQSFESIPIFSSAEGQLQLLYYPELAGKIFSFGLMISLPIITALMITSIALGVLTRAAPQLNLFALGFPLTLMGGFIALAISLNYLAVPLQYIFELALSSMPGTSNRH